MTKLIGEDDWDIPYTHSITLFERLLDPLLPPSPNLPDHPASWTLDEWSSFVAAQNERKSKRFEIVTRSNTTNFGYTETFQLESGSPVTLLITHWGGHNNVGSQEGVQDVIRKRFALDELR